MHFGNLDFRNMDPRRIPRAGLPPETLKQLDELNHDADELRILLSQYMPLRGDESLQELEDKVDEISQHMAARKGDLGDKEYIEKELNDYSIKEVRDYLRFLEEHDVQRPKFKGLSPDNLRQEVQLWKVVDCRIMECLAKLIHNVSGEENVDLDNLDILKERPEFLEYVSQIKIDEMKEQPPPEGAEQRIEFDYRLNRRFATSIMSQFWAREYAGKDV